MKKITWNGVERRKYDRRNPKTAKQLDDFVLKEYKRQGNYVSGLSMAQAVLNFIRSGKQDN